MVWTKKTWIAASLAAASLAGTARAADVCGVLVYSARVEHGAAYSDGQLLGLAIGSGSREALYFTCTGGPDAEVARTVIVPGSPLFANPGFHSNMRDTVATAVASPGAASGIGTGQVVVTQKAGAGDVTIVAKEAPGEGSLYAVMNTGASVITEKRSEVPGPYGQPWPEQIRIDTSDGDSIIQYFNYDATVPEYVPPVLPADITVNGPPAAPTLDNWGEVDDVDFAGNWTNFSFDFDTGYWPYGEQNVPGGFPIQVRLDMGIGFDVNASVNGQFTLDGNSNLAPAAASGTWGFDFGAELKTEACFDITVIDPICVDIPYIPNFDYRARAQGQFNSYLLDSKVELADNVDGGTLLEQSIGGLPGVVDAKIKLDAYGSVNGEMTCPSISTSDGLNFDTEGGPVTVDAAGGYSSVATYNESIKLTGNFHLLPKIKLDFLGGLLSWELPTVDLPIPVISGPLDLGLSQSEISFDGPPVLQLPLRTQGDFDASGCSDVADFLFLLDNWQFTFDGKAVGINDFLALLDNWKAPGC